MCDDCPRVSKPLILPTSDWSKPTRESEDARSRELAFRTTFCSFFLQTHVSFHVAPKTTRGGRTNKSLENPLTENRIDPESPKDRVIIPYPFLIMGTSNSKEETKPASSTVAEETTSLLAATTTTTATEETTNDGSPSYHTNGTNGTHHEATQEEGMIILYFDFCVCVCVCVFQRCILPLTRASLSLQ